jgi:hypothetical protein
MSCREAARVKKATRRKAGLARIMSCLAAYYRTVGGAGPSDFFQVDIARAECYFQVEGWGTVLDSGEDLFFETTASRRLVDLIERNADELTTNYVEDIRRDPRMPSYQGFDQKEIYRRAFRVYSQLGKWVSNETTKDEVKSYWTALGRQRHREGFPFSEIVLSLCHIRRLLWLKIQAAGLLDTALDLYQAMDLQHRVLLFFDRAIYNAAVGYEDQG